MSAALSAIQSGGGGGSVKGEREALPLVLIAHPDPELDIGLSLDSIIFDAATARRPREY